MDISPLRAWFLFSSAPLNFYNHDDDLPGTVEKSGLAPMFTQKAPTGQQPSMDSARLDWGTYTFDHLLFHWGDESAPGSEHSINGKK